MVSCIILTMQWIQNSNNPCQQRVQVCGFSADLQNNWLITQFINRTVNGTRLPQVSVFIQFMISDNCGITSNCQGTLSMQKYKISYVDTDEARSVDDYQLVERISLADARENKTISVNFNSSHSSFYLAIQDENSCIDMRVLMDSYMELLKPFPSPHWSCVGQSG